MSQTKAAKTMTVIGQAHYDCDRCNNKDTIKIPPGDSTNMAPHPLHWTSYHRLTTEGIFDKGELCPKCSADLERWMNADA